MSETAVEFTISGTTVREHTWCHFMGPWPGVSLCNEPGAYWYPALGGGVAVLCEEHGHHHFPLGAQRITDRLWHGGGEPLSPSSRAPSAERSPSDA